MFDKLDAYNLVANLVPGMALVYVLGLLGIPIANSEPLLPFLLASFVVGVAVNRIGSLVFDPILRSERIKFLHKKDYIAFVLAEQKNPKLENLVANSGLYRTFTTASTIIIISVIIKILIGKFHHPTDTIIAALSLILFVVFLFSFQKEDIYIYERIRADSGKIGESKN